MGTAIAIDGALVPPEQAAVPVLDRGFLYGDSAFEVIRTYGGRPFALGPHLERLAASCARLGIDAPAPGPLRAEVARVLEAAGNEESYLRVIVTRGASAIGIQVAAGTPPRRIVVALPLPAQPATLYEDGVALATVTGARALDGTAAAGAKASNYLPNILALSSARERGAYEAISVGPAGELLEGATSNLFVVREGRVATPPLTVGVLGGITRRVVVEAAAAAGVPLEERLLFPPDLYRADEAFITSTLREVVPAVRVDGVTIGHGRPGPVVATLRAAFRERVEAWLAAAEDG